MLKNSQYANAKNVPYLTLKPDKMVVDSDEN